MPVITYDSPARTLSAVPNLNALIHKLHAIFAADDVNVEEVQCAMEAYRSCPAEWSQYAKFDLHKYTRNLVDEGNGKFNLMLVAWGGGHVTAVHDHADAHCFMKVLQGELTEICYAWPESSGNDADGGGVGMKEIGRTRMELESVCYINDSIGLHRLENASPSEQAVSLHLYCPPFSSCSVFDQRTGRRTKCQVTFWSKHGRRIVPETDTK